MTYDTIKWIGDIDGHVELIDQTLLPHQTKMLAVRDVETMWQAIKILQVRGAPAIGIAAAFGAVLGLQHLPDDTPLPDAHATLQHVADHLAACRPTAVNLAWALNRLQRVAQDAALTTTRQLRQRLLTEAQAIRDQDAAMCHAIGQHGAPLIRPHNGVLTHCNAGGLATAEFGTALALMFTAHQNHTPFHAYVDETRPLLQGARLTAWELTQAGIDTTLITDSMAGFLMAQQKIHLVVTGADRIAANGDTANKIGTYALAVLAHAHQIPFYIAAPSSTFDLDLPTGQHIPIEQRLPHEVTHLAGQPIAPAHVNVYNPAFDVTPHALITAIITEKGLINAPNRDNVRSFLHPAS